jgi:hypothetical protein
VLSALMLEARPAAPEAEVAEPALDQLTPIEEAA